MRRMDRSQTILWAVQSRIPCGPTMRAMCMKSHIQVPRVLAPMRQIHTRDDTRMCMKRRSSRFRQRHSCRCPRTKRPRIITSIGGGTSGGTVADQVGALPAQEGEAGGDGLPRKGRGIPFVAAVQRGLSAAGLGLGHLDPAPGLFQKLDGGKPDAWTDGIHEAGHE